MSNIAKVVTSIQIAPYSITYDAGGAEVRNTQENGFDENTAGWAVYLRYDGGEVKLVDEKRYEHEAVALAKQLCVEHTVSIELYRWQVSYINPVNEALRKSYPPSYEALQDKTKAWAQRLGKLAEVAWADGIVLGFKDRHVQVNPRPVLVGDYPDGWESISAAVAVQGPEVSFLKHPEVALASSVAKFTLVRTPNGRNHRFLGQYIPQYLVPNDGSKGVIVRSVSNVDTDPAAAAVIFDPVVDNIGLLNIRPDHPLDPLLAPTVAKAVMTGSGVRLQLNPIDHGDAGITQAHVDLLAGINRNLADSGQPLNISGFSDSGCSGKRTEMFQGSLVNVGAIPPVTTEMPKSLEQQLNENPGHVYDTEGDVKIGVSAISSPADNARLVEGGLVRASQQAQMDVRPHGDEGVVHSYRFENTAVRVDIPSTTEDGVLISDTPVAKLELRTFESRGDHTPSDE